MISDCMKIWDRDTGYWMLDAGNRSRAAQALAPRVALLRFIISAEYLFNPVSSIQYPASLSITGSSFCPNNRANLQTK
jgi:hypothetical protein